MKTAKRFGLVALALLGLFWSGPASWAQDDNAQPSDSTATTTSTAGAMQAEDADSQAGQTAATDDEKEQHRINREVVVVFGKDAELKADESAQVVVVIGGSAKIHGKVREAVTVIGGDAEVDGQVGEAVVAVLGNVRVLQGGRISGDVVSVGGKVELSEGGKINGHVQEIDIEGIQLPQLEWLTKWLKYCVFMMRPLAPQVGWVWVLWGAFLLLYLLIAAVFPRPVQACVNELSSRPASTFLVGLLTKMLLPLVLLILTLTGVGMLVVPFLLAALFFGALLGKVAILESLGLALGRRFSATGLQNPLGALVLGAVVITVLYLVPILGILTFGIVSVWGLGGAVTAAFGGLRREIPERPAAPQYPSEPGPIMPAPGLAPVTPVPPAPGTPLDGPQPTLNPPPTAAAPTLPPVMPELLTHPRAGFWERMGAAFLDIILVSIVGAIVGGAPLALLVGLAYFAGMWAWRGTTIGGIILGLKVVRVDSQPLTFPVALVRALAGAFSVVVLFLGILWIAWDKEKQGWHDLVAGTVVLKLPRGTPLLCL